MLGRRLKTARQRAGLTQRGLADAAGVRVGVVQDVENGYTRVPAFDKLVRLARALDVDPLWLCPVRDTQQKAS
jgi:transcriptional regulator with XRE-family HTH domain